MFRAGETLNEWLQVPVLSALEQPAHAFLGGFSPRILLGAKRSIAQYAPLPPHLVCGEKADYRCDADDQGQDDFRSCAPDSPVGQYENRTETGWCRRPQMNWKFSRGP